MSWINLLEDSDDMYEFELISEGKEKIKIHLKNCDLPGAAKEVQKILDDVETIPLNIAVTGEVGSGKSTFINCMRGLGDQEKDSAPTGTKETTKTPTPYLHPHHKNVTYWDLPGIGSPNFKAADYLQKVNFDSYDFFIIIAADRFTENDILLAKEICAMSKHFYFVRSKIDRDIYESQQRRSRGFNEQELLKSIKQECTEYLKDAGQPPVFLISCFQRSKFDFNLLLKTLKDNLDKEKRFTYLKSLPNISNEAMEMKKKALSSILPFAAMNVAARCIIPGVSHITEASRIIKYINDFLSSFGLDNRSLNDLSRFCGKSVRELRNEMKSTFVKHDVITEELINEELKKIKGTDYINTKYALSWVPVLSVFVAGPMSAVAVYGLLTTALNDIAEDAKQALLKSVDGPQH